MDQNSEGSDASRVGSNWLEGVAEVPWDELAGRQAVEAALSLLREGGCSALVSGQSPSADELAPSDVDRQGAADASDPVAACFSRLCPCPPGLVALAGSQVATQLPDPDLSRWFASRDEVLVARVGGSTASTFLIVDPGAGRVDPKSVRFLARQLGLAVSRDEFRAASTQANDRLQQANDRILTLAQVALTDQTVNAVAHQINNYLTSVLGYSELLLQTGLRSPEENGYIRRIYDEAHHTSQAVSNMLNFLRRRSREPDLLDVNELIQQAIALQEYELDNRGIAVKRELDPDLPLTYGSAYKLQVALINLLLNAEQAVAETGRGGEIRVATARAVDRAAIRIEIADTGPGVDPAVAGRVFEPFFTTRARHIGLGLTVAQRLIEEHNGTIAALPGSPGAIFVIELPILTPEELGAPRILIVDNEPDVLSLLSSLLQGRGFLADTAGTAEDALRRLAATDYQCILADLRMPGIGGQMLYETASARRPVLRDRFVFITADNGRPEAAAFLARPDVIWVEKPFDLFQITNAVQRVLERTRR